MEMSAPLILDLPPETLAALRRDARRAGVSPSQHARRLVSRGLTCDAAKTVRPQKGDRDERPGDLEALLAPLRGLLAEDLARATSWADLQDRLAGHDYTFRERGGGLALFSTTTAARICKASSLGWSYASLIRRFDAPFPGHSHAHVAARVLKRAIPHPRDHPSLFPVPDDPLVEDDDDPILFEDE